MSPDVVDMLLDLRHFVTDEAEAHDPYLLMNQVAAKIDELMKGLMVDEQEGP